MTWTVDAETAATSPFSSQPNPITHTCASGARLLIAFLAVNGTTTRTGGAPTYNGTPMTDSGQGFKYDPGGECGVELWYLIDPDTGGAYNLSVPNTNAVSLGIAAASYIPSAGGCAFDNSNSSSNTTANPSLSLTVGATGNLIVGWLGSGYRNQATAGTNFTLHSFGGLDEGNQTWAGEYDLAGSATPVTVAFVQSADDWGLIAVSFAEVTFTPASDSQPAYTRGQTTASDNQIAYAEGVGPGTPTSDSQSAYTRGATPVSSSKSAFVSGALGTPMEIDTDTHLGAQLHFNGPVIDGNGNLYVLLVNGTDDSYLEMWKYNGSSWSHIDSTNEPSANSGANGGHISVSVWKKVINDRIWIATMTDGETVYFHKFRVSTEGSNPDTWELVDQQIADYTDTGFEWSVSLVRGDTADDWFVASSYEWTNLPGDLNENTRYHYTTTGTNATPSWTINQAWDDDNDTYDNLVGPGDYGELSGYVYGTWKRDDNDQWFLRYATDVDQTFSAVGGTDILLFSNAHVNNYLGRLVVFDDGSNEYLVAVWLTAAAAGTEDQPYSSRTVDRGTPGNSALVTSTTVWRGSNGHSVAASLAVDPQNNDVYYVFANKADRDLYYVKSTNTGQSWSGESEILDGITVDGLSANTYIRSGRRYLGIVWAIAYTASPYSTNFLEIDLGEYTTGTSTSDNSPAYTRGSDSASDNSPAYTRGSDSASDNSPAYTRGSSTSVDSVPAYVRGQAEASDNQIAYSAGQDTSSDNTPAYTLGSSSASSSKAAYVEGVGAGTDVSDNKPAYVAGSLDSSDSQPSYARGQATASASKPAYTAGSLAAADSSPAYAAGQSSASGNKPAYVEGTTAPDPYVSWAWVEVPLIESTTASSRIPAYVAGVDTSADSQPAYTRGSVDTSDNQIAYAAGQDTATDSQPAYVAGTATASDNQPAYVAGQSTSSDSKAAYTRGSVETSDSKAAYVAGGINVADNQIAYAAGQDTATDNIPAYVEGFSANASSISAYTAGVDTASDSKAAYVAGGVNVTDNQIAYAAGVDTASDNQPAYVEGASAGVYSNQAAYVRGQDTASDSQAAYVAGGINVSDSQIAYASGQDTASDSQPAYVAGQDTASDNKPAYAAGQDTASDSQAAYTAGGINVSDSQAAYVAGQADASDSQPAYVEGFAANTSNINAYTAGVDTTSDRQPAYVAGGINVADNQIAYVAGQDTASDSQPAYVAGSDTASDNQTAYVAGVDTSSDNQTAYARGQDTSSDSQPAYVAGVDTASDSKSAYAAGGLNVSDSQPAYIEGQGEVTSSIQAYVEGFSPGVSNIPAYTAGVDTASDSQPAYVAGGINVADNQIAYVAGQDTASDSQPAYAQGAAADVDSRIAAYAEGVGFALVPDGDITYSGAWKNELGTQVNLYQSVDEYPDPNDSDYVWYDDAQLNEYFEVSLSNPTGVPGPGDVVIHWRANDRSATGNVELTIELREGSTLIASSSQVMPANETDFTYTLSAGEKASISNWDNLRLRVRISSVT